MHNHRKAIFPFICPSAFLLMFAYYLPNASHIKAILVPTRALDIWPHEAVHSCGKLHLNSCHNHNPGTHMHAMHMAVNSLCVRFSFAKSFFKRLYVQEWQRSDHDHNDTFTC